MKIETKFSIGDKVKVNADPIMNTTCPFCQGRGKLEVNGTILYCQNCDDGVLKSRMMDHRQLTEGTITGIHLNVERLGGDTDGFEDDEFIPLSENSLFGICEEYYVEVDNSKFWGDGTYHVSKIHAE